MKSLAIGAVIMAASVTNSGTASAEQTIGPENYEAREVLVENFIGTINVTVSSEDSVSLQVSGNAEYMEDIEVFMSDGKLVIRRDVDFRDWSRGIFKDWNDSVEEQLEHYPVAEVSVPKGMALSFDGIAGRLDVGDLDGPLELSGWWLHGSIGDLTQADIAVMGSGDLHVGTVSGSLELDVQGSGDVEVESAGTADIDSAGSGSITVESIASDLEYQGLGSGDGRFGTVNGRVEVSVMGSGDVDIREGVADPLSVSIMGSADVTFGGTARHSHVSQMGSGRVRIAQGN